MELSPLVPVVQEFPNRGIADIENAVRTQLRERGIGSDLRPGARVAITAGSRGVSNIALITRAVAAHFAELGLLPFVIPAMGSHGGGTAEGQADVLAHYGITEATVGCPVVSSLDVVELGRTPEHGIPAFMDRNAFESDGVFLVNRVKWHTTFEAEAESGLLKMAAVGLGKLHGAGTYHRNAVRLGFGTVMREVGRHVIASSGKVLGGLAVLEGAHHETADVVALRAGEIDAQEPALLRRVLEWMPRILYREVDVLLVEEVGKHISGVGMDSKVVNRHPYGGGNLWPWAPRIFRIYVRNLSPLSYGNAIGIGMADVIPERLYEQIDWHATKVNAVTASNLTAIRTPVRVGSDREALELMARVVGRDRVQDVTCVWIRNTLELSRILVTENLGVVDGVERAGPARAWEFDEAGNVAGGFSV
ncbi:MAG: hypothetical protein SGI92_01845 [Bryobacteraceae bacterium]|nr:hypothetical protein [Bryobacteraceae bacterium]